MRCVICVLSHVVENVHKSVKISYGIVKVYSPMKTFEKVTKGNIFLLASLAYLLFLHESLLTNHTNGVQKKDKFTFLMYLACFFFATFHFTYFFGCQ